MSPRNGRHRPQRPRIELASGASATPEEAAAIAAAIEEFLRDTAPAPAPSGGSALSGWARAATFEAVGLPAECPSPWGDTEPWGATA